MALLHLLCGMKVRLGLKRIAVLHVNHGLRGEESDGDERFVAGFAQDLGCRFYLKRLSGHSLQSGGIEAWAREERYRFFLEIKQREGYSHIATGHTADDQAETVLLRLWRGTGLRGMRGILPEREDGVVRPLLDLRRNDIIDWLDSRNIPFRSDSSNRDCRFRRNYIRHKILPFLEQNDTAAFRQLIRIAGIMQEFWTKFQPGIDTWVKLYVDMVAGECFRIRKEGLSDAIFASEGLRSLFDGFSVPADSFHIDRVLRNASRSSGRFPLGGAWSYYPQRDDIVFCTGSRDTPGDFRYDLLVPGITECAGKGVRFTVQEPSYPGGELPSDNRTVVLDRDACGENLTYRSWHGDDRFDPLGYPTSVFVKDFLARQRYPKVSRPLIGVVEGKNGSIVWIPGVRISNRCRVSAGTRKLIKISYQQYTMIII